jgi:hypothetical protein
MSLMLLDGRSAWRACSPNRLDRLLTNEVLSNARRKRIERRDFKAVQMLRNARELPHGEASDKSRYAQLSFIESVSRPIWKSSKNPQSNETQCSLNASELKRRTGEQQPPGLPKR